MSRDIIEVLFVLAIAGPAFAVVLGTIALFGKKVTART